MKSMAHFQKQTIVMTKCNGARGACALGAYS
jgi:hypothetical protein